MFGLKNAASGMYRMYRLEIRQRSNSSSLLRQRQCDFRVRIKLVNVESLYIFLGATMWFVRAANISNQL